MDSARQELRWVLRAQAGDIEAFDCLLQTLQAPLYRYIRSLVGAAPLTEDILQEVFLLIYRKLRWLRDPELFRPWAFRIATREAFKTLRRERRWTDRQEDEAMLEAIAAPEPPGVDRELAAQLPELVAALSPASRAVLALHYLHELPLAQVAEILDLSVGTVKSRLAYGLACLRKQMNPNK